MQLRLEQIFNIEGERQELSFSFSPEPDLADDMIMLSPVSFEGEVKNTAGMVTLEGKASFRAGFVCARCAESFERSFTVEVSHRLVTRLENEENDDFIVAENCELDIEQLVLEDIVLSLPVRFLCREDCLGLCAKCGKNLNEGPCGCKKEVDPRLAALLTLLDDGE